MSIQKVDATDELQRGAGFLSLPTDPAADSKAKRLLWRQLGSSDRALLGTDGTFTALLAALRGEPVRIMALSQGLELIGRWDESLRLHARSPVLRRAVLMHARSTGSVITYAESV